MAIYHLSMKPIARSGGRSAVASAAYRASQKLTNERDGLAHDFTRRGGVEHVEIVIPKNSKADWALDRSTLWNMAEAAEKRKDARVAREIEVALPHELTAAQRLELTREFSQGLADRGEAERDVRRLARILITMPADADHVDRPQFVEGVRHGFAPMKVKRLR